MPVERAEHELEGNKYFCLIFCAIMNVVVRKPVE